MKPEASVKNLKRTKSVTETIISRLRDKINELGNQKILLLDQVTKIRKQVDELNQELVHEKAIVQRLENTIEAQSETISSVEVQADNEKKIDEMVKEIDKCLAILNK